MHTIVAEASEPVEDKTTWKCTLFKPTIVDGSDGEQTVVFRHVQTNFDVHIADDNYDGSRNFLTIDNSTAAGGQSRKLAESVIVDCNSLVTLPKFVAFAYNDKYLSFTHDMDIVPFFMFYEDDIKSDWIVNEVYPTADGAARFKYLKHGCFWTAEFNPDNGNYHIYPDDSGSTLGQDPTTWMLRQVFNVVTLDAENGIYALRCAYNKRFCTPLKLISQLIASKETKTIVENARFRVVEPVRKRKVKVHYHLDKGSIYDEILDTMAEASGVNVSPIQTDSIALQKAVEYTESRTWTHTLGVLAGVETTFKTGIPFIVEGEIKVKVEAKYEHQWAHTLEEKNSITANYTLNLEPRHKGTLKLICHKATCEIPFSYTQIDTLQNGQQVTSYLKDGIYKGAHCYNFCYQALRESLDDKNKPPTMEIQPIKTES